MKYEEEIRTKLRNRELNLMYNRVNNNISLNLMKYENYLAEIFLDYCRYSNFHDFCEKSDTYLQDRCKG